MKRILFVFTALLLLTWIGLPASPVEFGERPFIDIYKVPDSAIEQGHIRIKLNEKLSSQVQAYRYEEGSLKSFEIEELDALNLEFGITRSHRSLAIAPKTLNGAGATSNGDCICGLNSSMTALPTYATS